MSLPFGILLEELGWWRAGCGESRPTPARWRSRSHLFQYCFRSEFFFADDAQHVACPLRSGNRKTLKLQG